MSDSPDLVSAGIGFLGALVGGACSIIGVAWQQRRAASEQRDREKRHLKAVVQSLHDELETVRELYMQTIGARISTLGDGQPFSVLWPVAHDYFTVFQANAALLGHLEDHGLRKGLIVAYNNARALIDSCRLNNAFVEQFENAQFLAMQSPTEQNKKIEEMRRQTLLAYAPKLKVGHNLLLSTFDDALHRLRKEGALASK